MRIRSILSLLVVLVTLPAWSIGILVPRLPEFTAIQLGPAEVRAEVTNNLAKTRVIQEFYNPNPRQLEADFYFPVPKGANVTDFVLYMDGKPVKGEVLEKEKAREIYESIVRRMKDPGLLEWIDYNLFKVRVFPVPANGTQKIELEFAQPLTADQGTFRYVFPLKTPKSALEGARNVPKVKFTVDLASDEPVRNVYSPSHRVEVDQKDPKRTKVTVPAEVLGPGTGDFVLFYEPSQKDVALSLVATRPTSEDGHFALMLSPQVKFDPTQVTPNDVTFVIDTSGSMLDGNKIEQARRALSYCVSQLKPTDRFGIVRFSTEVENYKDGMVAGAKEQVDAAKQWIGQLQARGGTNISGALEQALKMRPQDAATTAAGRVYTMVFITDGLPTLGTTDPGQILKQVSAHNTSGVRIFTFGVGNDVNTKLLDRLADETRAVSEYIKPAEDMEVPISKFFDKIARPAMVNLKLEIPGGEIYDMYPNPLPDLFFGAQLTVFGRYKKPGATAIKLTGTVAGKPAEFTYEKTLPEREPQNDFVEKLWGTRKIGYMLDQIRRNGESGEVKDEVIRLAKKYGVVTPYTSYLVTEDTPPQPIVASAPAATAAPHVGRDVHFYTEDRDVAVAERSRSARTESFDRTVPALPQAGAAAAAPAGSSWGLQAQSGETAVKASREISQLRMKDRAEQSLALAVRAAGGRSFSNENGVWIDSDLQPGQQPTLKIKYLSQAYMEALRINPKLKDIFALGERILVKLPNGVVEIGPDGKEALDDTDRHVLAE